MLLSRQVYRTSLRRFLKDVICCSDTWPDWMPPPPLQRIRSWSKSLLSSPDTSPTLSGGELLDVLVTFGSCRLAKEHHWVSDGSGRRHRITVIMESRRNGPQLSTRHDDDDEFWWWWWWWWLYCVCPICLLFSVKVSGYKQVTHFVSVVSSITNSHVAFEYGLGLRDGEIALRDRLIGYARATISWQCCSISWSTMAGLWLGLDTGV